MDLRILLLAVAVATVKCVNREKLETTAIPQKAFSVDKYIGDWYVQARLPSCSWVGSSEFTNFVSQYSRHPSGNVHLKDTWRSSECASVVLNLRPLTPSGVFLLKDPIGNVISGKSVVVATDYKKFAIKWGCPKYNDGTCTDPYVVVKTTQREPSPHTWKMIEKVLDLKWELGLSEMIRITHDKDACVKFPPHKAPQHRPRSVQHLMKTY